MALRPHTALRSLRLHCVALALLLALGGPLLGPLAPVLHAAPGQPATWGAEWVPVSAGAQPTGHLQGLRRVPQRGLELTAGVASGQFESRVRNVGREYMAIGAVWREEVPAGAAVALEVRRSGDGTTWEPWQPLVPADTAAEREPAGRRFSELLMGPGRYLQVRATLSRAAAQATPRLETLRLVAIDSRQGPATSTQAPTLSALAAVAAVPTPPPVISRAAWGANEAWMTWTPRYAPVGHFIVHHTVTSNSYTDAAAQVRAIYYYHAVTLGWGDIGYNYLIDREGRIYEGRKGGDGVIAGHARPYNPGTVGVAILGDYSVTDVPAPAVATLKELLAWKGNLHFVDPRANSWLIDRTFPNIMGHRDCNNTTCPGDRAYALLPSIRTGVYGRMRAIPPHVAISKPTAGKVLSGTVTVTWRASAATDQLKVAVDGQVLATLARGTTSWAWNTRSLLDGAHTLRVTALTDLGQSASTTVQVQLGNGVKGSTPTATPARSPTPVGTRTPTPAPSTCPNLVKYGGFENAGGWVLNASGYPAARSSKVAHNGSWSLRVGIADWTDNHNAYSSAYQLVDIPAGSTSAVLRLWYYAYSGDWGDRQYIVLYDSRGGQIQPWVLSLQPAANDAQWHSLQYDVTAYAGQRIKILAGAYNNGTGALTGLYLDDVTLRACGGVTTAPTATPRPTSGPTPTATPSPTTGPTPTCTSAVTNGGFESNTGWIIPLTAHPAGYSTTNAHSGSRSLRLGVGWGQTNVYSYSSAKQGLVVPANARSATLRFWYYPISGDPIDTQDVWILDSSGHVIGTPLRLRWPATNGQAWTQVTYDLTPFLGQTVRLHFELYNDGKGGTSALYVDDVRVSVCP